MLGTTKFTFSPSDFGWPANKDATGEGEIVDITKDECKITITWFTGDGYVVEEEADCLEEFWVGKNKITESVVITTCGHCCKAQVVNKEQRCSECGSFNLQNVVRQFDDGSTLVV